MEHIVTEQLENGYYRLTAESGYRLYNTIGKAYFSEAIVKEYGKEWIAVEV